MSFDYPWTCPLIDSQLDNIKDSLYTGMSDLLSNIDSFDGEDIDQYLKPYMDYTYESLLESYEVVRTSNEDIRKAAESSIERLEEELELKEGEIEGLNKIQSELDMELVEALEEINNLQS
tara:strand:- start:1178 stop:1537 length:360 start_codon:yes stop_codon:yes gene_type:complete